MTILVTGATGSVGRHVVGELLDRGERVRALTRTPETAGLPEKAEVVRGDLLRPETLEPALAGVTRLYLFPVPDTAEQCVDLAVQAGVERVVVLSSDAVNTRYEVAGDSIDDHEKVESAVERSGLAWTFLRPVAFAGNTLFWSHSIRAESVVRAAYPQAAQALVHEADIAEVATAALLSDAHDGKGYTLTGPEAVTQVAQVRAIADAIGREVRFEEMTPEAKRAEMLQYLPADSVDMILGYFAIAERHPDPVTDAIERVTGHPARSFADWAVDHADAFR
ncbi:NAD(P)H-binding protein [Micromonospora sp. BRA006-A]|uniref:NAD(P)H-binding protein n=1 Tax=Micromonospora TaxID=1873 RepID=UPI00296F0E9A|nr:NAD(P)H-binding protein [Micromonospora sp. BRA006-A]MDW3848626.1 NAD(P)H-binding protein [Micromonospora sp. BRA006-A]